jgi:hypothetical protein
MTNATIIVKELNGVPASKTYTTVSSTVTSWLGCSDAYNSSPSTKIPIPSSGYSYSYWKSYCAEINAMGGSSNLDNWCFYMTSAAAWLAGGNGGTAGGLKAGYSSSTATYGFPLTYYYQATGGMNADTRWNGIVFTTGHPWGQTANSIPVTATQFDAQSYTSTGTTRYYLLQFKVDNAGPPVLGTIGAATMHIQYDES